MADELGQLVDNVYIRAMHTIRLRGPWQLIRQAGDTVEKLNLPAKISDLKFEIGRPLQLARSFHQPSSLRSDHAVFIVIETPLDLLEITLNQTKLKPIPSLRFPVRDLLAERNQLTISLQANAAPLDGFAPTSALEVRLEIEDEAQ